MYCDLQQCGKIPKLIMQTWKTSDVPDKWKRSPESIKELMPDWKLVLMTDEDNRNLILRYFPELIEIYDTLPYNIQRADIIRPLFLYVNGGVYMDLDYEVIEDFSDYLSTGSDLYFVPSPNLSNFLSNSFMASSPRHPIWLGFIENLKKGVSWWRRILKHTYTMSTGPLLVDKTIRQSKYAYCVLPPFYFSPCDVCAKQRDECFRQGILRPLEGMSWAGSDTKFFNCVYCNSNYFLFVLTMVLIFILLYFIFGFFIRRSNRCHCI